MKIFSKAYSYLLAGIWCCMLPNFMLTQSVGIMRQFRAPYSLSELLHDGLIFVQDSLEQIMTSCKQNSTQLLQMVGDKLQELENLYVQMHAKSVLHEMRRDERDFLQNLIDRIDQMINTLEKDESYSSQDRALITKNLQLLKNLQQGLGV